MPEKDNYFENSDKIKPCRIGEFSLISKPCRINKFYPIGKFLKISKFFRFFTTLLLVAILLFGCLGRTRPLAEIQKSYLPEYMRHVYINHLFNQSSEPFLDLEIYKMLQEHYSPLNYEKKLATLISKPDVKESRIILIPHLIAVGRTEANNSITLVLEIDLKITNTDRYLLKRKRLVIEAIGNSVENPLENAVKKLIAALDDYVTSGTISYQY